MKYPYYIASTAYSWLLSVSVVCSQLYNENNLYWKFICLDLYLEINLGLDNCFLFYFGFLVGGI